MKANPTLSKTYEEAERVEAEKESIEDYSEPKNEQSCDLEGMLRMMQKLSNKVIDLEKEEAQKSYKLYYERRGDNNQSKPPPHCPASMNLIEVGMDNFFTFHQQPHSKKNCPQWINSMTLVMNQLLDSKLTEADDEDKKGNKSTENQEEDALVLWDYVSMFDTEKQGYVKQEEISETNVTTRSHGLIKEDRSVLLKIKRLQKNVEKIHKSTTADKIPEFTIMSQNPKKNQHAC